MIITAIDNNKKELHCKKLQEVANNTHPPKLISIELDS